MLASGNWRGQWSLTGHNNAHCDVTVGHYYGQLMTAAHASCRRPAAALFTDHGQHAGHCPLLASHGHCRANENVKVGLNKVSAKRYACPFIENSNFVNFKKLQKFINFNTCEYPKEFQKIKLIHSSLVAQIF